MLIITVVKDTPSGKSHSITRAMWLIPGLICAALLASLGASVSFEDTNSTVTEIGYNVSNTNQIILNNTITTTETNSIALINPVWVLVHYMIFAILLVYVLLQTVTLLIKV